MSMKTEATRIEFPMHTNLNCTVPLLARKGLSGTHRSPHRRQRMAHRAACCFRFTTQERLAIRCPMVTSTMLEKKRLVMESYVNASSEKAPKLANTNGSPNFSREIFDLSKTEHKSDSVFDLAMQLKRPYMAGLGRFLTAAKLAEQLAGEHPYSYAFANPIKYTDPTGLSPECKDPPPYYSGPRGGQTDPAYWHNTYTYHPNLTFFWDQGFWGYGKCCGPTRKCGPGSVTYSCTDESCKQHDICVGPNWGAGFGHWTPCIIKLCNDIKYCCNKICTKPPIDPRQCDAIRDISTALCFHPGNP
jgi:RHS repeat-associated protein